MKLDLPSLCNELISALITGGAQGALIIAIVWGALKLLPDANASTRHAAWFATLLIVALLPVAIFVHAIAQSFPSDSVSITPTATDAASVIETPVEFDFEIAPAPIEPEHEAKANWALTVPKSVSIGMIMGWLALAAIRLGGLARQLVILGSIRSRATNAPESLVRPFSAIAASMGIFPTPRLLLCDQAATPMVVGFFKPAMLLPMFVFARGSGRQLEHLFRHELAHLSRRDHWTNLVQQVIAAIFFFHPGILFVSRRLAAEREIACDDHALAIASAPREYALFLTEFASQMKGRDFTAAPAAWSSKSQLKERIGMILNTKRNASPRVSRAGVGMVTITALGLAAAAMMGTPRLVVGAEDPASGPVIEASVAAPAVSAAPVVAAEPVEVSIALAPPQPIVRVKPVAAPAPIQIAAAPGPEGGPRIKMRARGDSDDEMERRLERLERMVEQLVNRDKPLPPPSPKNPGPGFQHNFRNEFDAEIRTQVERAHREADRARREVERVMQEHQVAARAQARAGGEHERNARVAGRESLKARRQALEAQRKQIEKELEAIDKQMEKEEDKGGKSDSKDDKKSREKDFGEDGQKPK